MLGATKDSHNCLFINKIKFFLLLLPILFSLPTHAAKMINLRSQPDALLSRPSSQPIPFLQSLVALPANKQNQVELIQIKKEVDAQGVTHIRYQQTYLGIPVWGGEAIEHISPNNKHASTNGNIFQDLSADLQAKPKDQEQIIAAENHAIQLFKNKVGQDAILSQQKGQLVVYVDENQKAHWAVQVEFYFENENEMPENPIYLIDATSYAVYKEWSGIHFYDKVKGGGLGGNPKMGMTIYDGLPGNKPALDIYRDPIERKCFMQNDYVTIRDGRTVKYNLGSTAAVMSFACSRPNAEHGNIYWNGALGHVNGAWSPANDALYLADKVNAMYEEWFHIPVLHDPYDVDKRMKITIRVHDRVSTRSRFNPYGGDNAAWSNTKNEIHFGDGIDLSENENDATDYPLVVPDVVAHELSHGFTMQHSHLHSVGESLALNESFSDMAGAAFEYYLTGQSTWMHGFMYNKDNHSATRYLDNPAKDGSSIENVKDYKKDMNEHDSCGIFNKVFYLLSQPVGKGGLGNPKIAFELMVQANRYHWTSIYFGFNEIACDVLDSAQDLNYGLQDLNAIRQAMAQVGLDTSRCH